MVALPVVRVQNAVPRDEVGFAVIPVASRLADGADDDRPERSVGAEVRRLHADLRGHLRVDDGDRRRHVAGVNDVGSVGEQRRAAAIDRAIDVDAAADRTLLYPRVEVAVRRRIVRQAGGHGCRSRQYFQQLGRVAAHKSKVLDVFGGQDVDARAVLRGNHLTGCFYRNRGRFGSDRQRKRRDSTHVSGVQLDSSNLFRLETLGIDLDAVSARYKRGESIQSLAVGLNRSRDSGR